MIHVYTQIEPGHRWLQRYRGRPSVFACILGFTATGLIPGISAAGATPEDRQYTAIADAEFLYKGPQPQPQYPLPPLQAGASPVLISRAVVEALGIPVYLFNAGLPQPPTVPVIDLEGAPAQCLSGGNALPLATVKHLWEQGLIWGQKLAASIPDGYLILGECVVGGTTTALAILTGLGVPAAGKVNSSHPSCNHAQKWAVVEAGLKAFRSREAQGHKGSIHLTQDPLHLVAAIGDPMQIAVAGMAIAASRTCGVMLAGGTQMLAVYALMQALGRQYSLSWEPEQVVVGTTRWVAEDPTGDTVGLAKTISPVPLLGTGLSFAPSRYPQLRAYEQGYVKEGMGAGGCAIAAHLTQGWHQEQLLQAIEMLIERC
ncbi:nicotinate mononucleotide-dependent phosphoribosyltransferase CobT [Trichocoleus sp. DQ-U1]|uniref:nicotinate mononucleotide-dependent phosphoribosyltransferase CobT n=1 Tax=Trichocoleus sp. DQ-U1 TaxID=2933926 RepID=UPI003298D72B